LIDFNSLHSNGSVKHFDSLAFYQHVSGYERCNICNGDLYIQAHGYSSVFRAFISGVLQLVDVDQAQRTLREAMKDIWVEGLGEKMDYFKHIHSHAFYLDILESFGMNEFVSIIIRRGDKVNEKKSFGISAADSVQDYSDYLQKYHSEFKDIHLITDDYTVLKELQSLLPRDYRVKSTCLKSNTGYVYEKSGSPTQVGNEALLLETVLNYELSRMSGLVMSSIHTNIGTFAYLLRVMDDTSEKFVFMERVTQLGQISFSELFK
jgi:hypothetical protein